MRREDGFTLVELMIGLGLLAILAAFAIPSYERLVRNNVADKFQDDLYADLALARSEALSRGSPVTLCASNDLLASGTPSCTGNHWQSGWMIFIDLDDDRVYDPADNETLVSLYEEPPPGVSLSFARDAVTFDRLGRTAGYNGTFDFCRNDVGFAEAIVLSNIGRARYAPSTSC